MIRDSRELILLVLLVVLLLGGGFFLNGERGVEIYNQKLEQRKYNELVDDTVEGQFAAAWRLHSLGELAEARLIYDEILHRASPPLADRIQYNLANMYLTQAMELIQEQGERKGKGGANDETVFPLIELSKSIYRRLLVDAPDNWSAKYNLEIALSLSPDAEISGIPEDILPEKSPESQGVIEAYEKLP